MCKIFNRMSQVKEITDKVLIGVGLKKKLPAHDHFDINKNIPPEDNESQIEKQQILSSTTDASVRKTCQSCKIISTSSPIALGLYLLYLTWIRPSPHVSTSQLARLKAASICFTAG